VLFDRSQAELGVLRAIERGSQHLTKTMLVDLLNVAASSWKPLGYDEHQLRLRLRYEGRALELHREARRKRYPATFARMPDVSFNWTGLVAQVDSAVYDYEPDRYLEGADGERLPNDDPASQAFGKLVRDAQLALRMPELERRAMVARSVFALVTWLGAFDEANPRAGKPCIELYWPSDVYVIPHASRPTDLTSAVALIARRSGPTGLAPLAPTERASLIPIGGTSVDDRTWYQVWTRPVEERPDGSIKRFGPWSVEHANLRGESYLAFGATDAEYPLPHLPWCVYRVGNAEGCPYVDEDRDFPALVDALNVNWSNIVYVSDMQGHDQPVISGHTTEAADVVVGPDTPIKIGPGETAQLLSPNPKLVDMLGINKTMMRTLAITRRQSPDAYATEPGPPLTGVSRKIANEPQDKARRERAHVAVDFERSQLLPLLLEVSEEWGDYGIPTGLTPCMTPRDPPDFEDPEARQRRSIEAADKGWIDDARGATEAGWYKSRDEAETALEALGAGPDPASPDAPSPMDAALKKGEAAPETTPSPDQAVTVNELTLGIERLGRLGDVETLNLLRRALAQTLGVPYGGDITAEELAGEATTVLSAETAAKDKGSPGGKAPAPPPPFAQQQQQQQQQQGPPPPAPPPPRK
jgi:hypothetical protein